jgi:hypothetical protein
LGRVHLEAPVDGHRTIGGGGPPDCGPRNQELQTPCQTRYARQDKEILNQVMDLNAGNPRPP